MRTPVIPKGFSLLPSPGECKYSLKKIMYDWSKIVDVALFREIPDIIMFSVDTYVNYAYYITGEKI